MEPGRFTEEYVLELAKRAYEQGRADFPASHDRCALLVIDMQDEFVKPHWTPYWVPEATRQVPKIKSLIEFCRNLEIPVIYTAFGQTHLSMDRPKTGVFMPNRYSQLETSHSEWFKEGRIYDGLKPDTSEIILLKPSYGAFYDTPLETILKNLNRDTVIICGTLTNFCCGSTARQAFERGLKVLFVSDLNSTDDEHMHEMELNVLRKGFARVLSSTELMETLNQQK
jgi:isochorismate hydrolase